MLDCANARFGASAIVGSVDLIGYQTHNIMQLGVIGHQTHNIMQLGVIGAVE